MSRFMSRRFDGLRAYVPGEQPRERKYIKLNTNESPYPPGPGTLRVAGEAGAGLNLYPDPECAALRAALGRQYGLEPECVLTVNGSDEALSFAFMAFCDSQRGAVFPDISYGFYRVYAELYGVPYEEKPLRGDFTVDPGDYMSAGAMVVLANPNAPTGLALPLADIERIAASNPGSVVLIDEAYVDFGGESAVGLIKKYSNLLVLGTYSKSRSLAGARLGFALGSPELIEDLSKIKYSTNPYNINSVTQAAGAAAIAEQDYYDRCCQKVTEARESAARALRALGFTLTDSRANFLFASPPGMGGEEYYLALRRRGILVRWFPAPRIRDYVRITVGTAEQMQALLTASREILEERT